MSQDAVLIVGAGLLQCALIRAAQALGLYVIAVDGNPQAPGFALAEETYCLSTTAVADCAQLALTLRESHPCRLRGCVTAGADCAPTVSRCCEVLETPGLPYATALMTHNKWHVRRALWYAGFQHYQPRWVTCSVQAPLQIILDDLVPRVGRALVVKPLTQRASRGVRLVADAVHQPYELAAALKQAGEYGEVVLLEERLQGSEHSAELLLPGTVGAPLWWNLVDRQFSFADGHAIETGHVNPSCLPVSTADAIKQMLLEAATALGVYWGPIKGDVILTADGPKLLEVTARLSGGFDSQGTSPLTGRHPLRQLLQLACGLPVEPQPTIAQARGYAACAAILPTQTGLVTALPPHGLAWALPWQTDATVEDVHWMIQPGDTLAPPAHNAQRSGFVLAHANEYADAWQRAAQAAQVLAEAVEVEA